MKKVLSTILVCVLLVGSIFTLASCAGLFGPSGTYENGATSLNFSGKSVELSMEVFGAKISTEATYEITKDDETGKQYISFTFPDDSASSILNVFDGKLEYVSGKDSNGSYVKIGGVQYYKAK